MPLSIEHDQRRQVREIFLRTQAPLLLVLSILVLVAWILDVTTIEDPWTVRGVGLLAAASIAAVVTPWDRVPRWADAVVPLLDMLAISALAVAMHDAIDTVAVLAALPAIWLAAGYGYLGAAVGTAGAMLAAALPLLVYNEDHHHVINWAEALLVPVLITMVAAMVSVFARNLLRSHLETQAALIERNEAAAEAERIGLVMQSFGEEVDLGIILFDERGEAILVNNATKKFAELAQFDFESGIGARIYQDDQVTPMAPDDQPFARLRRGENIKNRTHWVGPRGRQKAIILNARLVYRPNGEPAGSILIAQDITEVLRISREREDALATLAHELRTPLTSMIGYSELLLDDDLSPAAEKRVDVIHRNAEHMLRLTSAFLDNLHPHPELTLAEVSLHALVQDALEVLHVGTGMGDREVHVDVAPHLTLAADREALGAVLKNLLANAVKFSSPGDRIEICAGEDDEEMWFTVRNTGCGIDPEDLERIFDRFYRGGNARRGAIPGTGIGLSISREIVHEHGGTLTAERVESGACFKANLPRS